MVNLESMKSVWTTPTDITVTVYSPENINDLQRVINHLISVNTQDYMAEISFSKWNDPYISKVGVIMITPIIFVTIEDYEYLCIHFMDEKSRHDCVNVCGKDKLYIDSNFNREPFEKFMELVPVVKRISANSLVDLNKLFTNMLDMKPINDSYRYTLQDLDGKYLVHSSDQCIKNCMYVMLCKVFSYYNPLSHKREFLKVGDRYLTYFLSNNAFLANMHDKHHYDNTTFGMYVTLYSSFVEYYQGIVNSLINDEQFKVIDHYSRYIVFNDDFINKYKNSCCYIVEYNGKQFMVFESKEQIRQIRRNNLPSGFFDNIYILFEKNLDDIYKVSLLKSGCGGYDEIKMKDVPLK